MAYWTVADLLFARNPPADGRQVEPEGMTALAVYAVLGLVAIWFAHRTGFRPPGTRASRHPGVFCYPWRPAFIRGAGNRDRGVPARAAWGVPIQGILDSLLRAEDVAGLQRAYLEAGPMGRAGAALAWIDAGAAERRVEDAALDCVGWRSRMPRRIDLKRSLARQVPRNWLTEPCD
jgi:hypothetical protein